MLLCINKNIKFYWNLKTDYRIDVQKLEEWRWRIERMEGVFMFLKLKYII